jgi:AcrR family transcriptional regulator
MTAPLGLSRKDKSHQVDALLIEEAIDLINVVGPDLFTITELSRRSGLSTGAVYRRYDSSHDIFKHIWNECWPFLREFAEASYFGHSRSSDEFEYGISQFVKPSKRTRVAALILTCSRRVPLIEQVVKQDLSTFCKPTSALNPVDVGLRFASLSLTLGRCLLSEVVNIDEDAIRNVALAMIGTPEVQDLIELDVLPKTYAMVNQGQIDSELLNAGISLISQVGFEGMTTSRIARETGKPFSTYDKQFGNKDQLMVKVIGDLIGPILDFENQMRDAQSSNESAIALLSWNAAENATVRKLVAEEILVANTRDEIRKLVSDKYKDRAKVLTDLGLEGIEIVRGAWHFGNAYFVGMSSLGLLVPTFDMDFSGAIAALMLMRELVMESVLENAPTDSAPGQIL